MPLILIGVRLLVDIIPIRSEPNRSDPHAITALRIDCTHNKSTDQYQSRFKQSLRSKERQWIDSPVIITAKFELGTKRARPLRCSLV